MRKTILIIVGLLICSFLLFGCNGLNETCPDGEVSLNGTCTIEIDVSLSEENNQEVLALLENKVDLTNRALATNEDIRIAKQIISNLAFSEEETEVSIVITIENLRDTPIADMEIILVIPKELVESASMITSDDEFEIIEDDPIIKRKAKKIDPHKTGTWIARFLRPKKKTPITKKEAKKTKEVVVWDQWDPDGDGIVDEDALTRGDTGDSGPSGEPGELIRSINPDKRYNDDPENFVQPGPISCTSENVDIKCGNDCQWKCNDDALCARNDMKYFFDPNGSSSKICCASTATPMYMNNRMSTDSCCPAHREIFYGRGIYAKNGSAMSTTCCDEGDETTRKTGRPNGCCDTSAGKVVVYGGTDYIEGSYIETSICCGYSVDELIDNGTFSEAFRDMLTGNNYAALIAHNNAAFKAETDLVGSPSGCCDITQNILQKGERTFVNMSKCCSLDSAPGTTSDGKPTCDMVGSGSGSGANMASIQQQINPSQVLESYGLFAE